MLSRMIFSTFVVAGTVVLAGVSLGAACEYRLVEHTRDGTFLVQARACVKFR